MPTFSELIRSEEEILLRLLYASQRQLELAESGSGSVLIQHLEKRQQLWNEFELLEQQLTPHKGVSPECRIWKSPEERQLTESALNRCKELLEQILKNDEESLAKTAAKKDEVEQHLQRLRRGANAVPAYAKQSQLRQ